MSKVRSVALLVVIALMSPQATAAPKRADASEDDQRAKKLFEDGTRAFNLGEFSAAVELYRQAYKLKPEPGLLYNIAQSYRLANDSANAVFFYRSFLRAAPNTPNRKEVENRIKKLDVQVAEQKAPPSAPVALGSLPAAEGETTTEASERPSPTSTPVEPTIAAPAATMTTTSTAIAVPTRSDEKPLHKKWWLWTVVGVGVLGVGLGIGLGIGLQNRAPSAHFGTREAF